MNFGIIFRLLGAVFWIFAVVFVACGLLDLYDRVWSGMTGFAISAGICLVGGFILVVLSHGTAQSLFRREALATIGLGWILASILGALPYWLMAPSGTMADAYFASASGLTTTGASAYSDIESWPRGLLLWRSISQWIGGLGVVVLFVAILGFLGAGAKVLYTNESTAQSQELDATRVQTGVIRIIVLYIGLTLTCTFFYFVFGMSAYEAICHSFTTISTGGFSTRLDSIAAFDSPAIEWTAIVFMVLGGTSFILMVRIFRRDWADVTRNREVLVYWIYVIFAMVSISLIHGIMDEDADRHHMIRSSLFHTASLMTSTGYSTEDFAAWVPGSQMILLALMVVGGCTGSTAGGIKVARVLVGWRVCWAHIGKAFRSHIVRPIHLNGKALDSKAQEAAVTYLALAAGTAFLTIVVFAILEPHLSPIAIVSGAVATLFNVGPALGELGPTATYAGLGEFTKVFLGLVMITGRLEFYAILALFAPSFWRKFS